MGAEESRREEGCDGFLGKTDSRGGEVAVQRAGVTGFPQDMVSKLGKANPFSVWGETTLSWLSQGSNTGSSVTLENSLYLSEP